MSLQPHRVLFGVRATLLLLVGAVTTFTSNLQNLDFARVVFVGAVLLLALAEVVVSFSVSETKRPALASWLHLAIALLATVVIFGFAPSLDTLALTATVWAAATAVIDVWTGWSAVNPHTSREFKTTGILAGVLALLLLVVPSTPVSILGLFGGYCFVVGVFLAIAAYDLSGTLNRESKA